MSRLDTLLQELCPDGVEFRPLEQCCVILDNKRKPVTKGAREEGEYPYYGANGIQDYVSGYIFDGTFVLVGEDGSVVTPNGNPVVTWAEGKIWVNNHAHIIAEKDGILLRYLFHYIQTINVKPLIHGNIPKLTGGDFKALEIPVPPLEVQREIVRILDKFTQLKAELSAELSARRIQYEQYRDRLLTFGDDVPRYSLGDIALVTKLAGFEFTKYVNYSNEGKIIALRGLNVKDGHLVLDDVKYMDNSDFSKLQRSKLVIGDLLFTYVGTVGQVAMIEENDRFHLAPNVALVRVRNEAVHPRYLMYYMLSNMFYHSQIDKLMQDSSMKNIPMEKIRLFVIAVPSMDCQKRIVEILDDFDRLTNSIKIGLPAEIEARTKQYEFYRDKLLSFKRKETS